MMDQYIALQWNYIWGETEQTNENPLCDRKHINKTPRVYYSLRSALGNEYTKCETSVFFLLKVKFDFYVRSVDFNFSSLKLHGLLLHVLV